MARRPLRPLPDGTYGERVADFIGAIIGSWLYVASMVLGFGAWVGHNVLSGHPFDPWPCIILGLVISVMTILQESVMLMAQNRAARQAEQLAIEASTELHEVLVRLDALDDRQETVELLLVAMLRVILADRRSPAGPDGGTVRDE